MITNAAPTITWHRTRENILAATASPYSFLALPAADGAYRIAIAPELGTPPEQWSAEDFFRSSLIAADESIARDQIALLMRQHEELQSPAESHELDPAIPTPWGDAHRSTQFAEGFARYDTKGPSGYHLDPTLNALIHPAYRREDGWYDDHIDWSKAALTFPTLFPNALPAAEDTLRRYEPDAYERVNGVSLALGRSDAGVERTEAQELAAMRRMNLPEYAQAKHGYSIEWRGGDQGRAVLTKGDERVRAVRDEDGRWSYDSNKARDHGDIVDFERNRGAKTAAEARLIIRPFLEQVELERGRLDISADSDREAERGWER